MPLQTPGHSNKSADRRVRPWLQPRARLNWRRVRGRPPEDPPPVLLPGLCKNAIRRNPGQRGITTTPTSGSSGAAGHRRIPDLLRARPLTTPRSQVDPSGTLQRFNALARLSIEQKPDLIRRYRQGHGASLYEVKTAILASWFRFKTGRTSQSHGFAEVDVHGGVCRESRSFRHGHNGLISSLETKPQLRRDAARPDPHRKAHPLEDELNNDLHVERLARADAGRTLEVTGRVAHQ